jgi:predicted nuclease of predicted toxin-antitoxin system
MAISRILADENIAPAVAGFLRQSGFDVKEVLRAGWQGKTDDFLLEKALNEKRFILSHDSDFGSLAIKEGKRCYGIIFLRTASVKADEIIVILKKFISLKLDIRPGTFIVIDSKKVRIRQPEVMPAIPTP